jgi:hypothetical protein
VIDCAVGFGARLYGELQKNGRLKARADRLVREWERQRWQSRGGAQ